MLALIAGISACAAWAEESDPVLRVCADPNNMPQSNQRGEGYENRIAEELARDLGRSIEYTWFPQRMGFVRNTLRQRDPATQRYRCDVIIGVPKGYELTATTQPYMRSTYALLFPDSRDLQGVRLADDLLKLPGGRLKSLRIGVFGHSPGADWLLRNGLLEQAVVYAEQSGDPAEHPALIVERDLAAKKIDIAIVWGPIAGFLARQHSAAPAWRAAPFLPDREIRFDYQISMGVRFGEKEWQATLDQWIASHHSKLAEILASYRVPLLDANGRMIADGVSDGEGADTAPAPVPLLVAQP
ncbi:MAG: quinoprotein dehydrogenase-associated putative ABC transporter substrate-binding protein [Steroidobacter sp.]